MRTRRGEVSRSVSFFFNKGSNDKHKEENNSIREAQKHHQKEFSNKQCTTKDNVVLMQAAYQS
jgi:hypothetical protein